jgi:Type II secretion system (T2SS), protein M subtype b
MNISLSPAIRRALALAILLTVLLLIWTAAIEPLIGLGIERRSDIADLLARLAHLEAIVARRPLLQHQARSQEEQLAAAGGLWHGASAAAIAAAVQDRLRKAVTAGGGRVDSSSEAHETIKHGVRKITVHFSIEGTLDTVTETLAAVETARPALFTDGIAITAPDAAPAASGPPMLRFELDVSGYLAVPRP